MTQRRELVLGMEVMITFDVSADLDVANRARGNMVDIALLDVRERRRRLEELTVCSRSILVCQ